MKIEPQAKMEVRITDIITLSKAESFANLSYQLIALTLKKTVIEMRACTATQAYMSKLNSPVLFITTTTTTTVLRPFVRDYRGEPVPEETLAHPPS